MPISPRPPAAAPSPNTWPTPPNPPNRGCRPGNSSTFISLPTQNYGWQLFTTPDTFSNQRFLCKEWNGGGGRMFAPRSLYQQSSIESVLLKNNPSITRYWLGIKQTTWGSKSKYVYQDGIRYTVRWARRTQPPPRTRLHAEPGAHTGRSLVVGTCSSARHRITRLADQRLVAQRHGRR